MWILLKKALLNLWTQFKKPIVFVGAALLALIVVVLDAIKLGKRLQQRKEIQQSEKQELEKVDRMSDAELHDDILRRSR